MKKDIFIDTNIAKNFTNPMDKEYLKLIYWLQNNNTEEDQRAYLVVSKKLLSEYFASSKEAGSSTSIPSLINKLTREGRLDIKKNDEIRSFKVSYFTKKVERKLTCNSQDREHIPLILLSDRKYALTIDKKLKVDLENFPGFNVLVSSRPEEISYDK